MNDLVPIDAPTPTFNLTPQQAREAWVEALRSGEFQQTQRTLCRLDGAVASHCCLGVACELFSRIETPLNITEETQHIQYDPSLPAASVAVRMYENCTQYLPDPVRRWLGLASHSGRYTPSPFTPLTTTLAAQNDSGRTFAQIADLIDSSPIGLVA
jgi:hypothetical protein